MLVLTKLQDVSTMIACNTDTNHIYADYAKRLTHYKTGNILIRYIAACKKHSECLEIN